jgi:hypothetical protein
MQVMTKEGNQEGVNERQGPLNEGSKSAREKRFYQTTKELNMKLQEVMTRLRKSGRFQGAQFTIQEISKHYRNLGRA